MRKLFLAAGLALTCSTVFAGSASAFDRCRDLIYHCYDRGYVPFAYAVPPGAVYMEPEWRAVVVAPPVVRTYAVPVVAQPGRWRTVMRPPVYAMARERVVVESRFHRPRVRTIERPVMVRPPIAARVYQPPVYGVIARERLVRPAGVMVVQNRPVVAVSRRAYLPDPWR